MIDRTRKGVNRQGAIPGRRKAAQGDNIGPPPGVVENVFEPWQPNDRPLIPCIASPGRWGWTISPIPHQEGFVSEQEIDGLRQAAGFWHHSEFGVRQAMVRVEIFRHESDSEGYLAQVEISDNIETILIQTTASLLWFLATVASPLVLLGKACEND